MLKAGWACKRLRRKQKSANGQSIKQLNMESTNSNPSTKKTTTRGRKPKAKGLGDTIEQITEATGIKAAVEWFSEVTGVDCGCDKRKEWLNEKLPYPKVECLNAEEYRYLTDFFAEFKIEIKPESQMQLATIHARVFNHTFHKPCTCSPREWKRYINELRSVHETYEIVK